MEDVPIFEEGEEVAGAGEAAAASVVSSENWSTRTNDMLDILRKQFEKKVSGISEWNFFCYFTNIRDCVGERDLPGAVQGCKSPHRRCVLHGGAAAEDLGTGRDSANDPLWRHLGRPHAETSAGADLEEID